MGWVYNASPAINAESNYPTIIGVSIPLVVLMVIVVCLRLYVRMRMVHFAGPDDWIIVAGAVNFAGRPFYMAGILSFKVALCLGYLRILSTGQHAYRVVVWITLVTCVLAHLAGTLVLIFNCSPVKKSWRPLTPGTCLPFGPTNYGLASTTIVFDVIIFFLPIPFLYALRMDNRRKYGIIGVFLLGLFTTICSIMRTVQIPVIAYGDGNSTMLVLWGNIEMNIGIILTCMPVLAPLFKFFSKKFNSRDYRTDYRTNSYGNNSRSIKDDRNDHNLQVLSKNGTGINKASSSKYQDTFTKNESQETILSNSVPEVANERAEKGQILKTIEVRVQSTNIENVEERRHNKHFV
ncbi:hypothetical protein B7463_g9767, partial [Scytalidium lignicola]